MDIIFEAGQLEYVAKAVWKEAKKHSVWAFHAPMGAGKTTFIHALCNELKVEDTVSSPTFAIINEYRSPLAGTMYHMDWYRLKDEEEAIQAGVEDALLSGNVCLVEWPEKAASLLPVDTLHLFIEVLDANTRRIYSGAEVAVA
ncbi:MAG: tRNA (adenosine(37)-N6)-threonylcarbamoyltransferase complex ATPase subunit type 1 TsaE [Bacteroidota bacterium]|nr:tRNA (adenosine(37)-N6)-threonylcarbamoyltransferase complex ATPase subunit type 1 TsaE [Bacteroidota bacterium]